MIGVSLSLLFFIMSKSIVDTVISAARRVQVQDTTATQVFILKISNYLKQVPVFTNNQIYVIVGLIALPFL